MCYERDMTETASTPFFDIDDYIALPRVAGLAVSPDGSRVVTTVTELNDKRTEYVSAVWEVDPTGERPARRLTRGAKGESSPAFSADGDVLFVAVRPTEDDDKPPAALWRLPAAGGEAVESLVLPGGVQAVCTAREAAVAVVRGPVLPSAQSIRLRKPCRIKKGQINPVSQKLDFLRLANPFMDCGLQVFTVLRKNQIRTACGDFLHRNIEPPGNGTHVLMEIEAMDRVDDDGYSG